MRPQGFGQGGSSLEDLAGTHMVSSRKPAIAPSATRIMTRFGEELSEQPLRNPLAALTTDRLAGPRPAGGDRERFATHDEDGEGEGRRICR